MTCPYGKIGEIYDYGVNDVYGANVDGLTCSTSKVNEACQPNNKDFIDQVYLARGNSTFSKHFHSANLWTDQATRDLCNFGNNTLYISYSCVNPEDQQYIKYRRLCWVVLIGVMNAFLFVGFLRYMFFDNQFTKD